MKLRPLSPYTENVLKVLRGCKELVYFDVSSCFNSKGEDEISKLGSRISTFKYFMAYSYSVFNSLLYFPLRFYFSILPFVMLLYIDGEYQVFGVGVFPFTSFVKSVINRNRRSATMVALPSCCTEEALVYVAEE
ncbi:hypothetical protein Vadar_013083 [Vaccinium darrowii]|uniref:Uncharacterized protein n=1 Tax=Vaccinium darrowii TaxID=229202 RepID=A0ACB7YW50_9ERIC|nr:hypothetical protein Vadar_013083 [Vaccinium darrowii]